jgi:Spy/CpxP family protein refolding chaperone
MLGDRWLQMMSGLVLVGVFAAGALFGAGLMRWNRPDHPPRPPAGPIEAMTHELDLDASQIDALHAIEAAHRPALDAIMRSTQPRVREQLHEIEDELRAMNLRADQIQKLEAWRARRSLQPPPPPPPMGP